MTFFAYFVEETLGYSLEYSNEGWDPGILRGLLRLLLEASGEVNGILVKSIVPFGVLSIIRQLVFRAPHVRDHDFDNHPYTVSQLIEVCNGEV